MNARSLLLATALALLAACSSGGSDDGNEMPNASANESGLPAFCDGLCAGLRRCEQPTDTCESDCLARTDLNSLRASSLVAVGACASTEDCKQLRLADATARCFQQAHDAEPLRQAVIDYCEAASLSYFRCDWWWPVSQCATEMNLVRDEALTRARNCFGDACADMSDCIEAEWQVEP